MYISIHPVVLPKEGTPFLNFQKAFPDRDQSTEKNIPEERSIFSISERTNFLSLKISGNELYEYQYFEFFKSYDSPRVLKGKSLTAILDIE